MARELAHHLGLRDETVLPVLLATELAHTASLVVDDLPEHDNQDMRRGRPTIHKKYDHATASYTGHYLRCRAMLQIGRLDPPLSHEIQNYLNRTLTEMLRGQMLDEHPDARPQESIERIYTLKTGLGFEMALWPVARLAGQNALLPHITQFSKHYGIAYQGTDDLIDMLEGTGKTPNADERNNRHTIANRYTVNEARHIIERHTRRARASADRFAPTETFRALVDFGVNRSA